MKKKTIRAITDTITIAGSALVIGLIIFGLGYLTADNQPIPVLDVGKICLEKDEMDKTRASDYGDGLRKGQQGCDDFTMNNCISKWDLISEIGNCGYEVSCPPVPDCLEPEIVECEEEDCSEERKKGFAECTAQSKMYE